MDGSVMGIMAGMFGTGSTGTSAATELFTDTGMSFGEVLSGAVSTDAAGNAVIQEAAEKLADGEQPEVTFAQLTQTLADEISQADENVIKACLSLVQLSGKAVAALSGGNEDESESITGIFTKLFGMTPKQSKAERELISAITDMLDVKTDTDGTVAETDTVTENVVSTENILSALHATLQRMGGVPKATEDDDTKTKKTNPADMIMAMLDTAAQNSAEGMPQVLEVFSALTQAASTGSVSEEQINIISDFVQTGQTRIKLMDYIVPQKKEESTLLDTMSFSAVKANITDAAEQVRAVTENLSGHSEKQQSDSGMPNEALAEMTVHVQSLPEKITAEDSFVIDDFITQLIGNQITEKLVAKLHEVPVGEDGVSELTIVLKPERLGEIAVKLVSENGTVSVVLAAQNSEVGKAISDNINVLAANLSKQDVEVRSVNVINPSEAGASMGLDFTNQGFNRRQSNENETAASGGISPLGSVEESSEAELKTKEGKLWATA